MVRKRHAHKNFSGYCCKMCQTRWTVPTQNLDWIKGECVCGGKWVNSECGKPSHLKDKRSHYMGSWETWRKPWSDVTEYVIAWAFQISISFSVSKGKGSWVRAPVLFINFERLKTFKSLHENCATAQQCRFLRCFCADRNWLPHQSTSSDVMTWPSLSLWHRQTHAFSFESVISFLNFINFTRKKKYLANQNLSHIKINQTVIVCIQWKSILLE